MPELASLAFSLGMILAGAGGTQYVQSPKAWPQTVGGYGNRVADLAGFTVVQAATQKSLEAMSGWRPYAAVCVRERLIACTYERTFTGFDRNGIRHRNYPLIAGIVVGSAASVLWRPERQDDTKTLMFISTRILSTTAGAWGGRIVHDWLATRPVRQSR